LLEFYAGFFENLIEKILEHKMSYFNNNFRYLFAIFLAVALGACRPSPRTLSQTCKYDTQTPQSFGNLVSICSIAYTKDSQDCIGHLSEHYKNGVNPTPVIERYIQIWNQNFDTLINKSTITLYQGQRPDKAELLSKNINMTISKEINNKNFSLGDIKYSLSGASFTYSKGQAYPNFANKHWGGGVLGHGNVQEEIKMRQSNALVWIAQAANAYKNHTEWCPSININNLDVDPVVMKLSIISDFDNDQGYGKKLYKHDTEKQKSFMTPKDHAEVIYSYAMAAPEMSKGSSYNLKDLDNMLYVATTAFYYTMLALDHDGKAFEIHTGNWGAGAFNNSLKMGWAIQLFAIKAAYELFLAKTHKKIEIKYDYDANSPGSVKKLEDAYAQIKGFLVDNLSAQDYLKALLNLANTDDTWQVQK
jgi:hypothetical protein